MQPWSYCLALLAALCAIQSASAAMFKCVQPDGGILYQQTACPPAARSIEIDIDTLSPSGGSGSGSGAGAKALSVEGQLKAMQSARERQRKVRKTPAAARKAESTYDRARCAKHRAQSARWEQEVLDGYRNPNDRSYKAQMLEHHRALAERYCATD